MQMHHSSPPTNPSDLSLLPVLPLLALFDCAGDEPLPRFERQALRLLAEARRPLGAREQLALAQALPFWRQAHRLATRLAPAATAGRPAPPSCLARLGAREAEVARRYAAGESYKVIARAMGVAPDTVRSQLQQVYRKLGVHDKIALLRAIDAGAGGTDAGPQAEGGSWKPPAR